MSHIYPDPMPTSFTAVGQTGPYQPQLQQQMSNQINNGGPAFPLQSIGPEFLPGYSGMTLRDYFAAAALQGLLAYDGDCSTAIGLAYHTADAMLDWRKKNQ